MVTGLSEYLRSEIEDLGHDPVRCGIDRFADRLMAWYAAKDQSSLPTPRYRRPARDR
jgi:hypothetical protein